MNITPIEVLKYMYEYGPRSKVKTNEGSKHVCLPRDKASLHVQKSRLVKQFLKLKKVTVLPHAPHSSDLAPCVFSKT